MDLFIDKSYENDVESKLNYHSLLYGSSEALTGLTVIGTYQYSFKSGDAIIVRSTSISGVHITNSSGNYLQEFLIGNDTKKFVDGQFS